MGDVKPPAHLSVPSPALLRLRGALGGTAQGQVCGAVGPGWGGIWGRGGVPSTAWQLQAPASTAASSSRPALPCPALPRCALLPGAGCLRKAPSPEILFPSPWWLRDRNPVLLCNTAGTHSLATALQSHKLQGTALPPAASTSPCGSPSALIGAPGLSWGIGKGAWGCARGRCCMHVRRGGGRRNTSKRGIDPNRHRKAFNY